MENNKDKQIALLEALKKGITEVGDLISIASEGLVQCATLLRVDQSEKVFSNLSEGLKSLNAIIDFIVQVEKGIDQLNTQGYNISKDSLACWGKSIPVFEEMLSAFESKDWVTVCDLIQYEIDPLLKEGEQGLKSLLEILNTY